MQIGMTHLHAVQMVPQSLQDTALLLGTWPSGILNLHRLQALSHCSAMSPCIRACQSSDLPIKARSIEQQAAPTRRNDEHDHDATTQNDPLGSLAQDASLPSPIYAVRGKFDAACHLAPSPALSPALACCQIHLAM